MLLNSKGDVVHVPHISHKSPDREAILTPLREVLVPESLKCHSLFQLRNRARFIEARK